LDFRHPRSHPIETAGEDQDARDSREGSRDASGLPPRAHRSHVAKRSTAAAEFERLKARLRRLVGTNNTKR
jgi:hypothetical protein